MKKIGFVFTLIAFLAFVNQAAVITVNNFSFEQPGDGKIKGWDLADGAYYVTGGAAAEVPGWESDGTVADSGVESDWPGHTEGLWTGFMMSGDPSIYNLTGHVIAAGEEFTLQVDARDNWTDGSADFKISLYYDVAGVRNPLASTVVTLDAADTWATYSLTIAADTVAGSIGHPIGIELDNVSATGSSWEGFDNVRLDVVPEPMTLSLLALGAVALRRARKV